jgi:hypothetical protein
VSWVAVCVSAVASMTAWTVPCIVDDNRRASWVALCVSWRRPSLMTAWTALCVPLWRQSSVTIAWACALVSARRRPPYVMEVPVVHDCVGGAMEASVVDRRFTQMLSGVDGLYTFSPSLCNQSVRVIRILVNSHVDLCLLSSARVPRL